MYSATCVPRMRSLCMSASYFFPSRSYPGKRFSLWGMSRPPSDAPFLLSSSSSSSWMVRGGSVHACGGSLNK